MVAQFRHRSGLVFGTLQRKHLGGAGLAGGDVFGAGEGARAGALLVHADHGILDHLDMCRLERRCAGRLRLDQASVRRCAYR
jgi:hypothetical protein